MDVDDGFAALQFFEDRLQGRVSKVHAVGIREENKAVEPEDVECVGELLDPKKSLLPRAGGRQQLRESPQPVFPHVPQLLAVNLPDGFVQTIHKREAPGGDPRQH